MTIPKSVPVLVIAGALVGTAIYSFLRVHDASTVQENPVLESQLPLPPQVSPLDLGGAPVHGTLTVEDEDADDGKLRSALLQIQANRDRVASLEHQLVTMRSSMDALGQQLVAAVQQVSPEDYAEEAEDPESVELQREQAEYEQMLEFVEEREAESEDPAWSTQAQSDIVLSMGAAEEYLAEMGASVGEVDCRSTYCRISVSVNDRKSISHVLSFVPWDSDAVYYPDDDDETTGSLYVSRGDADAENSTEQ